MNAILNLAKLIAVCNGVDGRKKVQKIVHLLQHAGYRKEFPYEFGYLHFGPYSHAVKHDLDLLTQEKAVHEEQLNVGGHTAYRYRVDPGIVDGLRRVVPDSGWNQHAERLNTYSPQLLEAASTIAFLREHGIGDDQLQSRFKDLKPSLTTNYDKALEIVGSLRSDSSAPRPPRRSSHPR